MKRSILAATVFFAVPAFAQAPAPVTGVGTAKSVWEMAAGNVLKSAEMLPACPPAGLLPAGAFTEVERPAFKRLVVSAGEGTSAPPSAGV